MRNGAFWCFAVPMAAVWFGMVGRATVPDIGWGVLVIASGWLVLRRLSDLPLSLPPGQSGAWLWSFAVYLFGYVAQESVRSTFRVFAKVLEPELHLRPAILAVPVPCATRAGLILLAYGISLTPGQQLVDLDEEARVLYVHFLDAPDLEEARASILDVYHRYLEGRLE